MGTGDGQADVTPQKATICVVNYKTLEFTRLCLRSIRKFTDYPYQVIVVDNGSQDESLEYLRSLDWIQLIEREPPEAGESGSHAHAAAIDMALEQCNTEFFVSLHSDTFVYRHGWLGDLVKHFAEDENTACVGSGKLELTPAWRQWLKKVTDFKAFKRKLLATPDPDGHQRYHNRTICCVYRTAILKHEGLSFVMGRDKELTVGKKLYFELVDRGYRTVELPPKQMSQYVVHLAHATQVINPNEFTPGNKTIRKTNRITRKVMNMPTLKELKSDNRLDD